MRYVFVGQNILGAQTLRALLAAGHRPELVVTREPNHYPNAVDEAAAEYGVPTAHCRNVNTDEAVVRRLAEIAPDAIFCSAWGNIVREPLLGLPRLGWVNFHPSYLPEYRGSSPISWQLINGERFAGGTAHFMVRRFDEGNILVQERIPILDDDDSETLRERCGALLGKLAVESFRILDRDPGFRGTPQDAARSSYHPPRDAHAVIDPARPAAEIRNLVRGLSPFPCAVLRVGGAELRVGALEVTEEPTPEGGAGRVYAGADGALRLAAADRVLRVTALRVGDGLVPADAAGLARAGADLGAGVAAGGLPA